jgi:hypothetical protein
MREARFAERQTQPIANALPHHVTSQNKPEMSVAARQKRWRENHPALHRNRHTAYMQKWRAAKKEAAA